MKTIIKIGVILSVLFFTLGLGSVIASVALGATWSQFINAVDQGEFYIPSQDIIHRSEKNRQSDTGSDRQYYYDVESLDVEFKRGTLEVVETDEDEIYVEVLSDPSQSIQTFMDGGTLKITTDSQKIRENARLRICLPEDEYFDEAELDMGAAAVTVENLDADELKVKLGAGSLSSTGEILSEKSEWEIGVGELNLSYLDCEDTKIDCAMGTVSLALAYSQDDYDCDITCGAGAVNVGKNSFSMGHHEYSGDDAESKLQIECGMGTVDVTFDED